MCYIFVFYSEFQRLTGIRMHQSTKIDYVIMIIVIINYNNNDAVVTKLVSIVDAVWENKDQS
jgi:hypothetical protein